MMQAAKVWHSGQTINGLLDSEVPNGSAAVTVAGDGGAAGIPISCAIPAIIGERLGNSAAAAAGGGEAVERIITRATAIVNIMNIMGMSSTTTT